MKITEEELAELLETNPALAQVNSKPLATPEKRHSVSLVKPRTRPVMTEKALCAWLEDLLTVLSYLWCHFRPARTKGGWRTAITGHKGWFDYVAIRRTRFIVIEVKSEKGKLSPEQKDWHDAVDMLNMLRMRKGYNSPVEKYILKPSSRDKIEEVLR